MKLFKIGLILLNFVLMNCEYSLAELAIVDHLKNQIKGQMIDASSSPLFQQLIDESILRVTRLMDQEVICRQWANKNNVMYSLGVSESTAVQIIKKCANKSNDTTWSKVMQKKYYFVPVESSKFDSWTDFGNRTYIYIDSEFDEVRLDSILLHELAIAFDAKSGMFYSRYLFFHRHFSLTEKERSKIKEIVIDMSQLSEQEKILQTAFNYSTWRPLSLTFAAMRAFNYEKMLSNEPWEITHQQCREQFEDLFYTFKDIYLAKEELIVDKGEQRPDRILEFYQEIIDLKGKPLNEAELKQRILFVLSEELEVFDHDQSKKTFCQYMAKPLLTNSPTQNSISFGPRPRLTGGTGGQGGSLRDTQRLQNNQFRQRLLQRNSFDYPQQTLQRRPNEQSFQLHQRGAKDQD